MATPLVVVMLGIAFGGGLTQVSPASQAAVDVHVKEERGIYTVDATFPVSRPPAVVLAVLTDYEQIPRFMPDVKKSVVQERTTSGAVVEQEALSKFMMFSKRVHLRLEVQEDQRAIRFRDTCGRSFTQYEGQWTLADDRGQTSVRYQLTAKPSFDVPEFILKRLLRRDAAEMIQRLQREIAQR
jgi:carbon monoxide dehydrogenase subunit G